MKPKNVIVGTVGLVAALGAMALMDAGGGIPVPRRHHHRSAEEKPKPKKLRKFKGSPSAKKAARASRRKR